MKLVVKQGAAAGSEFALDKPVMVIGRSADADILLTGEKVSRRHAQIRLVGNQLYIVDLGSLNGIYVNGVRITGPHPLRAGDELGIGDTIFGVQEGLAYAGAPAPVAPAEMPVGAPQGRKLGWVLGGIGALMLVALLAVGGWRLVRSARPIVPLGAGGGPTLTPTAARLDTPTPPVVVIAPTAPPTESSGAGLAATATARPTFTPAAGGAAGQGTPPPQNAPFRVAWSQGRYEGWADGRRMSSDLTIENISLPQISPPYSPYFIISDASGNMRVGELHDYSSPTNQLPTLAPGQYTLWTWFTIMSNEEWVRGSVFRYAGWSWAQEFNLDGSLNGLPRVISDRALIPFLPVKVPPEQIATIFPTLAPSFVPTRAP